MSDEMWTRERTMYLKESCSTVLGTSLWSKYEINDHFSRIKVPLPGETAT